MGFAYHPEAWHDFYIALAGACAALWGLIFVAISLHPGRVADNPIHRNRARLNLIGLYFLLVVALLALIPGQPAAALGIELVLIWTLWTVVVGMANLRLLRRLERVPGGIRARMAVVLVMSACGICSGVTLWLGTGGGLLWNVAANVLGLAMALTTAWSVSFSEDPQESGGSKG